MDLVTFLVGTGVLLISGDLLVRGAIDLSVKMSVSPMVIGLTVIAFGTSAPELLVGVQATWSGFSGLALGNIVGSNIANTLLILGVAALIFSVRSTDDRLIENYLFMLSATVLFTIFALNGGIQFWKGLFLVIFFVYFIGRAAFQNQSVSKEIKKLDIDLPQNLLVSWKLVLFFITGFLGLPLGANLLINGATGFAESVGISDEIIGLTIVAVGTSLPELAASISAAYRREVNLLIGNVIGSNMFNILGIGGLVAMISPLNSSQDLGATSFFAMCMSVLILAPFIIWRKAINRLVGIGFLLLYVTYILTII